MPCLAVHARQVHQRRLQHGAGAIAGQRHHTGAVDQRAASVIRGVKAHPLLATADRVKTLQPRPKFRLVAAHDLIIDAGHLATELPQPRLEFRAQLRRGIALQQQRQNRV